MKMSVHDKHWEISITLTATAVDVGEFYDWLFSLIEAHKGVHVDTLELSEINLTEWLDRRSNP